MKRPREVEPSLPEHSRSSSARRSSATARTARRTSARWRARCTTWPRRRASTRPTSARRGSTRAPSSTSTCASRCCRPGAQAPRGDERRQRAPAGLRPCRASTAGRSVRRAGHRPHRAGRAVEPPPGRRSDRAASPPSRRASRAIRARATSSTRTRWTTARSRPSSCSSRSRPTRSSATTACATRSAASRCRSPSGRSSRRSPRRPHLVREKRAEEKAVVRAADADKKRGVAKSIIAVSVVVALAGVLAVWFFTRRGTHNDDIVVARDRIGAIDVNGDIKGKKKGGRRRRTRRRRRRRLLGRARASRTSSTRTTRPSRWARRRDQPGPDQRAARGARCATRRSSPAAARPTT